MSGARHCVSRGGSGPGCVLALSPGLAVGQAGSLAPRLDSR